MNKKNCHRQKVHFARKYSDHTILVWYGNQLIYHHPFYLILKSLGGIGTHLKSQSYESIMTKNLPAPECVIELCICKCKTSCTNLRCMCKKNSMLCTEMCLWVDCCDDENDNDNVDSIDEE